MTDTFNFTTERLRKITCPPGKARLYVRDRMTRGLILDVTAGGSKSFYVYRRIRGKPSRYRLGGWPELSIEDARKEADKANGEIARGSDPAAAKRAAGAEMTFGELFHFHLENAKLHNRAWIENQRSYDRYLKLWANRRLTEIDRDTVEARHARIGENNGHYAANRALALISHMFRTTAKKRGFKGDNPAVGIERFREKSRERFLHPDEMPKFLAALDYEPELFRDFFLVTLLTGARRDNVQSMRWADISFERATWRILMTKSGEALTIPLVPEVIEIFTRRHQVRNSEFVFPSRGKTGHLVEPKTAWKRILARAGIADLRIHDLRRTFGSWQAAAGVSLHTIGKSMGHKNQSTTAIYARLNVEPVRAAVTIATTAMLAAGKTQETK